MLKPGCKTFKLLLASISGKINIAISEQHAFRYIDALIIITNKNNAVIKTCNSHSSHKEKLFCSEAHKKNYISASIAYANFLIPFCNCLPMTCQFMIDLQDMQAPEIGK